MRLAIYAIKTIFVRASNSKNIATLFLDETDAFLNYDN